MLNYLNKYIGAIKIAVFVVFAVVLSLMYREYRNMELKLSEAVGSELLWKTTIQMQNAVILANGVDANKTDVINREIKTIQTFYETKYETIVKWEEDNNGSTCENAISYINNYQY